MTFQRVGQTGRPPRGPGEQWWARRSCAFAHACRGELGKMVNRPSALACTSIILPQIGQLALQAFELEA
jgi:hypothetical protein